MALKRILTKDEHAKLADGLKGEYKADDKGENFILDLTDYEDPVQLKTAKDHEKKARKAAEDALKAAQDQITALTEERDGMLSGTIPKADLEKLKTSYETKLAKANKDMADAIAARDGQLSELLVTNVAQGLASELFTAPALGLPHVAKRLKSEFKDGRMVTVVLDAKGQPTELTPDDLKKEILANPDFKTILTGSKGSGGGANGAGGGGGAPKALDYSKATPKEIADHIKATSAKA